MSMNDTRVDSVSGDWHLLDVSADEQDIPQHRMDLRLDAREERCRGAILHRVTGEEILLAGAVFDGLELRLQMYAPPAKEQTEMPWLVMTRIGAGLAPCSVAEARRFTLIGRGPESVKGEE